jgi:pSer/pThr/pTyr-binding forkhead associated (FHA) protein
MSAETLPEFLEVYLDVVGGPAVGAVHKLTRARTVIGRGAEADLRLSDRKLSRNHASIFYTGSGFRIRDERSANGTLLNGSLVVEYAIRDGDRLLIGESLLRFRYGSASIEREG